MVVPVVVIPSVPDVTIGEPVAPKIEVAGTDSATLVTVPPPLTEHVAPASMRLPLASIATQCPEVSAPEMVPTSVVFPERVPAIGDAPAPPPNSGRLAASNQEDDNAEVDEK